MRMLSSREARVAEFLALGQSGKQIAGELGTSQSTVSRLLHRARRKLALGSSTELAALFSERGESARETLFALSAAEREVASLVSRGRSDAEIAATRRTSRRTVENQLQHVYRKLGVHSRTELAARVSV